MSKVCDIGDGGSRVLLSQDDPPPFTVLDEAGGAQFLIVCDHAGRRVPRRLVDLGLAPEAFERHIALDIGAAGVTEALAGRLGAGAVLQTYSRLVIDCNRAPEDLDSIPARADGLEIPANATIDAWGARARLHEIFEPYHRAIAERLARPSKAPPPVLIALHSFTPKLAGVARPWRFGVLHDGRSPFSLAMLDLLREETEGPIGDNEPYAMDGTDFTVPHHAMANGLDYLELEIRQDLIAEPGGQAQAAALLARLLPLALLRGA